MTRPLKILAVDDEAAMREVLRLRLEDWGHQVLLAADGAEARRLAESESPDLVLSDVVMPDVSGLELLESIQAGDPGRPVILITAYGSVDEAVDAMKKGARDFLTKPLDYPRLRIALEDAARELEERQAKPQSGALPAGDAAAGRLLGTSRPMKELLELIRVVAGSDAFALITGESGTGKELVCRTIHELSARRDGPLVAVNAAALPEGITESELFGHEKGAFTGAIAGRAGFFEQADGGTLFLDELAEMPITLQPKLLRVLEERRVRRLGGQSEKRFDVRVIAATNRDPRQALSDGLLREDLYYRLSVFTLVAPPLRDHPEDVPLLARHFLEQANARHGAAVEGLAAAALEVLARFSWPGNVRELRNVIERAVILARRGRIERLHLPPYMREGLSDGGAAALGTEMSGEDGGRILLPGDVTSAEAEKIVLLETLKRLDNNKSAAARQLGIDVKTVRNRLRAYGLESDD